MQISSEQARHAGMAIQRFAADSGYIVVGDRQHGGEEPGWQATSCVIHIILKLSLGCGRAGANRPSKPSPQLSIGAMRHQSSFRVQSLPSSAAAIRVIDCRESAFVRKFPRTWLTTVAGPISARAGVVEPAPKSSCFLSLGSAVVA
jgi:hypothetical protein